MNCNHNNSYHISTDNTITTWQDIIGDIKKNKAMAQLLRDVMKKVDKEDGKCLIPVDELMRLAELHNYDDTEVKRQLHDIQELLDSLDLSEIRAQLYSLELAIYDLEQEVTRQEQRIHEMERVIDNVATKDDIPTKVSQLRNDAQYITRADVPTKVSELQNDSDFITAAACSQIVESTMETINPLVYDDLD